MYYKCIVEVLCASQLTTAGTCALKDRDSCHAQLGNWPIVTACVHVAGVQGGWQVILVFEVRRRQGAQLTVPGGRLDTGQLTAVYAVNYIVHAPFSGLPVKRYNSCRC